MIRRADQVASETEFWRRTVRPSLLPFGVLHRIENLIEMGTPDVTYCLRRQPADGPGYSGWIETKFARAWPKRDQTLFRFAHYTADQAEWLESWGRVGGRACLLCQVELDYLLVPPEHCKEVQRGVTRGRFYEVSAVRGRGVFPTGRVLLWLTAR